MFAPFSSHPISTMTIVCTLNCKLDVQRIFNMLPVTQYIPPKKTRGRKKKGQEPEPEPKIKPGSIISAKFREEHRGATLKKVKTRADGSRKYFRNQTTIDLIIQEKRINIKIFSGEKTGGAVFHITGCKTLEQCQQGIGYLWNYIVQMGNGKQIKLPPVFSDDYDEIEVEFPNDDGQGPVYREFQMLTPKTTGYETIYNNYFSSENPKKYPYFDVDQPRKNLTQYRNWKKNIIPEIEEGKYGKELREKIISMKKQNDTSETLMILLDTVMINTDYHLGFQINRTYLDLLFSHFSGFISDFEPSSDTGVNIRVPYQHPENFELPLMKWNFSTSSFSFEKIEKNKFYELFPKRKEKKCVPHHTFIVFGKGKIIQTGRYYSMMEQRYNDFMKIIFANRDQIEEKNEEINDEKNEKVEEKNEVEKILQKRKIIKRVMKTVNNEKKNEEKNEGKCKCNTNYICWYHKLLYYS